MTRTNQHHFPSNLPGIIQIAVHQHFVALLDKEGKVWINETFQKELADHQRLPQRLQKVFSKVFSSPAQIKLHDGFVAQQAIPELLPRISSINFKGDSLEMVNEQGEFCSFSPRSASLRPRKLPGDYREGIVRSYHSSNNGSVVVDTQGSVWCRDKAGEYEIHDYLPEVLYAVLGERYVVLLDINKHVWAKELCSDEETLLDAVFNHMQSEDDRDCYTKFVKGPQERKFRAICSGGEFAMCLVEDGTLLVCGFKEYLGIQVSKTGTFILLQEHPLRPKLEETKPQKSAHSVLPELQ